MQKRFLVQIAAVCALLAVVGSANTSHAASVSWTGAGTNMNSSANWGGTNPSGNDIHFYTGTPAHLTDIALTAVLGVGTTTMDGGSATGDVTIGGAYRMSMNSAAGVATVKTNVGAGTLTFNNSQLNGNVSSAGSYWDIASATTVVVNSSIIPNGNSFTFIKSGAGTLTLNGNSSTWTRSWQFGDATHANFGIVNINNAGALGQGAVGGINFQTGVIDNTRSDGATVTVTSLTGANGFYSQSGVLTFGGTHDLSLGAYEYKLGLSSKTITTNGNAALTIGGPITASSTSTSLTKQGLGLLKLGGQNTWQGGLTISAGTVQLLEAGDINDNSFIKVAGGGDAAYKVSVAINQLLSSHDVRSEMTGGTLDNLPAKILNDNNTAAQDVTMTWRAKNGTDTGNLADYMASNVVDLVFSVGAPTYVLQMQYDPSLLNGVTPFVGYKDNSVWTLAGLAGGSHDKGNTAYDGSDLTVGDYGYYTVDGKATAWVVVDHGGEFAVVPEPGTIVLLATGLLGLLAYAWRKRK